MRHINEVKRVLAMSAALCFAVSCAEDKPEPPPPRETVLPLLRQEAESLKRDGEDISPKLEVDMTWEIGLVDVWEQPGNEPFPWAGNIHITIVARIKELDGYITEKTEKDFDYAWDMNREKWLAQ